jgi:hypothetical protein
MADGLLSLASRPRSRTSLPLPADLQNRSVSPPQYRSRLRHTSRAIAIMPPARVFLLSALIACGPSSAGASDTSAATGTTGTDSSPAFTETAGARPPVSHSSTLATARGRYPVASSRAPAEHSHHITNIASDRHPSTELSGQIHAAPGAVPSADIEGSSASRSSTADTAFRPISSRSGARETARHQSVGGSNCP